MKKQWKAFLWSILCSLIFVSLIGLLGGRLNSIELLPDSGSSWYYWKLPSKEFWPSVTAWAFYLAHQLVIWVTIYKLQHSKQEVRFKLNLILLLLNGAFILLHIIQSHIWYDGLAQYVPVWTSQGSVIVMLVLILIMDNDRRGLFFGKKINGFKDIKSFIRKYHGYFIAWAITYTFWYHPTVSTPGHLVGFLYMFLLFIQLSMAYTPIHTNKYWTFTLEIAVLFHGTAIAIAQNNNMWPMFAFGFGLMAVVTQLYGVGLSKLVRSLIQLLYFIAVIVVFSDITGIKSLTQVHQITWIPIIEYGLVFIFLFVGQGLMKLFSKKNNKEKVKN